MYWRNKPAESKVEVWVICKLILCLWNSMLTSPTVTVQTSHRTLKWILQYGLSVWTFRTCVFTLLLKYILNSLHLVFLMNNRLFVGKCDLLYVLFSLNHAVSAGYGDKQAQYLNFMFEFPCIISQYYIKIQQDATLAVLFIRNCKITLHVSDAFCVHHQEY